MALVLGGTAVLRPAHCAACSSWLCCSHRGGRVLYSEEEKKKRHSHYNESRGICKDKPDRTNRPAYVFILFCAGGGGALKKKKNNDGTRCRSMSVSEVGRTAHSRSQLENKSGTANQPNATHVIGASKYDSRPHPQVFGDFLRGDRRIERRSTPHQTPNGNPTPGTAHEHFRKMHGNVILQQVCITGLALAYEDKDREKT